MTSTPLRKGFTTGSCAAAAAKAALIAVITRRFPDTVVIHTLNGARYEPEILEPALGEDFASCGVRKDGGDDPDATTGLIVRADVTLARDDGDEIRIDGGEGVGRVTRPGLDQPVGNAAINSGPRRAVEKAVREALNDLGVRSSVDVVISVPGGEEVAKKTFNPRLGIEGGISILGTTGVVEPMSTKAILDTIRVELRQQRALQRDIAAVAPGNYGLEFIRSRLKFDLDKAVKCSNYLGDALDYAAELGFKRILVCGHLGKLIKTSGGIFNTHSRDADARMELCAAAALDIGADAELARRILRCVSTDEVLEILRENNLEQKFLDRVVEKLAFYLDRRAAGRMSVEAVVYSNKTEALATTPGAEELLSVLRGPENTK